MSIAPNTLFDFDEGSSTVSYIYHALLSKVSDDRIIEFNHYEEPDVQCWLFFHFIQYGSERCIITDFDKWCPIIKSKDHLSIENLQIPKNMDHIRKITKVFRSDIALDSILTLSDLETFRNHAGLSLC